MGAQLPLGEPWPDAGFPAVPEANPPTLHAYVHIPFCEVRCGYCDFNTYTAAELGEVRREDFHRALAAEIVWSATQMQSAGFVPRQFDTVFFGGGTPTLFSPQQLDHLLKQLRNEFGLNQQAEITVEANPDTLSQSYLEQLRDVGVNRLSIGVQSFDATVLRVLDRTHDATRVADIIHAAKAADFEVSIDLIYGSPGETLESWRRTLSAALQCEPDHISAYSLIVEAGTAMERKIRRGQLANIDEDLQADMHQLAAETLDQHGYRWYEISNWTRSSESQHNLAYWKSNDWWGYGPGAHSHISGVRWWNHRHPLSYVQQLSGGKPAAGFERLTTRDRLEERLLLGLRTRYGAELEVFAQLGIGDTLLAQLADEGKVFISEDRVTVSPASRMITDGLALQLLSSIG